VVEWIRTTPSAAHTRFASNHTKRDLEPATI
jgi:hypothetical protein